MDSKQYSLEMPSSARITEGDVSRMVRYQMRSARRHQFLRRARRYGPGNLGIRRLAFLLVQASRRRRRR